MVLDKKDALILNMLQEDCRVSFTKMAREVGLSIDSVKKRVQKLKRNNVFFPKIQLRPRNFGYNHVVDIKVKLRNYSDQDIKSFVTYLMDHPRVVEIFSVAGEWDFSLVIIAKDGEDLAQLTDNIRNKFLSIIWSWAESLTTVAYKFEIYDMLKLVENEKI